MEPLGNALARLRTRLRVAVDDLPPEPDPEPECPICRDSGFLRKDVPVGDPDFGRLVPCSCRRDELRDRLRRRSQIGALVDRSFDNFRLDRRNIGPNDRAHLAAALEFLRGWVDAPTVSLLLLGPPGCGKTHLAAAIANQQIDRGTEVFFAVVPDLLDHLRATFAPGSDVSYDELFETVKAAPLLILDDLGTQSSTAWAQEKLFQILNHRYTENLRTVITTNESLSHLDDRLRSRLEDNHAYQRVELLSGDRSVVDSLAEVWPEGLRRCTFESFNTGSNASLRDARDYAEAFAENPDRWLVLQGPVGCGKTHLAAAIKNQRDEDGLDTLFTTAPDLLDYLRATYAPDSNVTYDKGFDAIRNASVLILDDYGAHSSTPWAEEKLFQLLNYRFNARLATVITTNQPMDRRAVVKGAPTQELRILARLTDEGLSRVCKIDAGPYNATRRVARS